MECKNCHSRWEPSRNASKTLTACPFCGADLATADGSSKGIYDNSKDALAHIMREHGADVLLGSSLKNFFNDYAPGIKRGRKNVVFFVIESGAAGILKKNLGAGAEEQENAFRRAVQKVVEEYATERSEAESVMLEFTAALGWKINIQPPKPPVQPLSMSKPEGVIAKAVLPIIYVIDTSESMSYDGKIETINELMHECNDVLREIADENPDAEIKIGALKFSSGAQWLTESGLISLETFYWNDVQAGGDRDLGAAIKELESKLRRGAFLVSDTGFCYPIIIFVSDGSPTDDWQNALRNANATNRWFQVARKIAIAIGDDADKDVLEELVGNREAVISASDLESLKYFMISVPIGLRGAILPGALDSVDGDWSEDGDWSGDDDWY